MKNWFPGKLGICQPGSLELLLPIHEMMQDEVEHGSSQLRNALLTRTDDMAIKKSTEQELAIFLERNPAWVVQTGKLHREFVFQDFCEAFGFMSEIALVAEQRNHHPEWFNAYKKVAVDLTTHEAGGITQRDFDLAEKMNEVAARR